ncbi:hypothetical protein COCSADRAFT_346777 [Bipolaris sorokiniana ND90Pr]|uniref:Uncharacterized protein n=1 Tax=Cochliobolus sativus (strain ND90Pr / ATCC 201652) TaxID=665912 RepID=M2STV4_COCSN|nr:uncharacterized protein COCSADRAFT_346777 [Bipolaris sorokiniana ND90Pr]EMD60212.1 hypothetical protein COCSADRAFT_346777 [Bipolaris sorokiniana ND90Pr]
MHKRAAEPQLSDGSPSKKQNIGNVNDSATLTSQNFVADDSQIAVSVGQEDMVDFKDNGSALPNDMQDIADDEDVEGTSAKNKTNTECKTSNSKSKRTKKPPVGDGFAIFTHNTVIPPANPFWGIKPLPGDPRPDPIQPSARESNGQTNPPLWEDRGYRYKRGSRYVKYFGPIPPSDIDSLDETLDQEALHIVKLIDMRPKSKKDPMPKRKPTIYCYGKTPKDWNNMQTIKALNDRRYQAIDRTTMDHPWQRIEREYLASLLQNMPDASIWELTERHNARFMGQDFTEATGFGFANLSSGRTVESVRYEYMTNKSLYDAGKVPEAIRWRSDPSVEGKAVKESGRAERAFGKPSRALEMAHDVAIGRGEEEEEEEEEDDEEEANSTSSSRNGRTVDPFEGQERLDDDEEMLLELAGAYGTDMSSQPIRLGTYRDLPTQNGTKTTTTTTAVTAPIQRLLMTKTQTHEKDTALSLAQATHPASRQGSTPPSPSAQDVHTQNDSLLPTEPPAPQRRTSLHAMRKMDIDENYSDEDNV